MKDSVALKTRTPDTNASRRGGQWRSPNGNTQAWLIVSAYSTGPLVDFCIRLSSDGRNRNRFSKFQCD